MKIQYLGHPTLAPALLLMFGLAAALPAAAAKGYHLWYDENGQAVYSQFPPDDGRPTETVKPPPPPAEDTHPSASHKAPHDDPRNQSHS